MRAIVVQKQANPVAPNISLNSDWPDPA